MYSKFKLIIVPIFTFSLFIQYSHAINCSKMIVSVAAKTKKLSNSKIKPVSFDIFDTDIIANEVIDFNHWKLRGALNDFADGEKLKHAPGPSGTDEPENITIHNIQINSRGDATLTLSAEQDAYTYYGDYAGRVRFFSQVKANKDGELKRVNNKTRIQVWDTNKDEWTSQLGGIPLPLNKRPIIFEDNDWISNEIIDFEHSKLMDALNASNSDTKLKHTPVGSAKEDPENLTIQNISIGKSGITNLTMSVEKRAYTYYGDFVGYIRFTSTLKPNTSGNLERVAGKTKIQVWDTKKDSWGPIL